MNYLYVASTRGRARNFCMFITALASIDGLAFTTLAANGFASTHCKWPPGSVKGVSFQWHRKSETMMGSKVIALTQKLDDISQKDTGIVVFDHRHEEA